MTGLGWLLVFGAILAIGAAILLRSIKKDVKALKEEPTIKIRASDVIWFVISLAVSYTFWYLLNR
jgi:hypothetical protein